MAEYEWQNSEVFKQMHPRKRAIVNMLASQSSNKHIEESAGLVMAAITQMKKERLSFTREETAMMLEVLTADMSPEEMAKVEMMKKFFK